MRQRSLEREELKLKLQGHGCSDCKFKLLVMLQEQHKSHCMRREAYPEIGICNSWEETDLESELIKTTNKLAAQRTQRMFNVKVNKPSKADIKEWYDWSILGKADD